MFRDGRAAGTMVSHIVRCVAQELTETIDASFERMSVERPILLSHVLVVAVRATLSGPLPGCIDAATVVVVGILEQLSHRSAVAFLDSSIGGCPPEVRRAAVRQAVQHLEPGGRLMFEVASTGVIAPLCEEFELERDDRCDVGGMSCVRRTARTTVHDVLFEARSIIARVDALGLSAALATVHPPLVIDTRTQTDRLQSGVIPASLHVPRTVLEWHLDPANGHRHPSVTSLALPIVVVCNGGYSSSLGAANLVRIGFLDVSDLIGGVNAWKAQGLPMCAPDHSYLDL